MPIGWDFLQVIDLFFKIHMVFNIKFEINIAPAMKFLGHFMYEMGTDEFKQTLRVSDFYSKFNIYKEITTT